MPSRARLLLARCVSFSFDGAYSRSPGLLRGAVAMLRPHPPVKERGLGGHPPSPPRRALRRGSGCSFAPTNPASLAEQVGKVALNLFGSGSLQRCSTPAQPHGDLKVAATE